MYICIYTYTYTYVCTYIHTYVCIGHPKNGTQACGGSSPSRFSGEVPLEGPRPTLTICLFSAFRKS